MLMIRLSRFGKTKQPTYRLIVSEKTKDPWGDYLENLGTFNPRSNPPEIKFKADRIKFWLSKGAQLSETVNNLLIDLKVIEGDKRKKVSISKRRKVKLDEKAKATKPAAASAPAEATPVVEEKLVVEEKPAE